MFVERLQAAQAEVKKDQEAHKQSQKEIKEKSQADELTFVLARSNTNIESEDDYCEESIIHKVSDFLSDVWDANQMEECKQIAAFEERAVQAFMTESKEYTLEQKSLHEEFCALFEGICTGFLEKEGYSVEDFYEEVRQTKAAAAASGSEEEEAADEVVNVIYMVVDFSTWAAEMQKQAQYRQTMASKAAAAAAGGGGGGRSK